MVTKYIYMFFRNYFRYFKVICVAVILSLISSISSFPQSNVRIGTKNDLQINSPVNNGIFVDSVKVYDDSSLQLMLNAARLRLASLQSFDQTGLLSRIGALSGASLQQQSISAQIMGPPLPSTAVTSLGATGSTNTVNAPTGQTITTVAGQPVENTVTTTPQSIATAPALPANAVSLPTGGFNVSSLDALNEMMQLNYEISNLQLLLEGSLSDRYATGSRYVKPRTTVGFPITIATDNRYKDAVAIVEVEVANPDGGVFSIQNANGTLFSPDPPTVTALLPREKTYNVASITDKMTSVGGGIVTQVISGGASFLWGRKSYYIVQDQDTLAMMQRPGADGSTVFAWQFRPVLGQSYVRSGLKQTFVQLSAPLLAKAGCFGKIKIRTYWRKYDRKKGVLKEVIESSIRVQDAFNFIPKFDTTPVIAEVDPKDLGSGVIQTSILGRFLPGTYIRIGNNFYREGSPGFTSELTQIRFIANASEIARHKAFIVSRDGTETEIINPSSPASLPVLTTGCQPLVSSSIDLNPKITPTVSINTYDGSNSILKITIPNIPDDAPEFDDYNILIGNKIFGLSDAPIERIFDEKNRKGELTAVVPTSLLTNSDKIEIKPLFWRADYSVEIGNNFKAESSSDKVVIYEQKAGGIIKYLLYGNRLANAKILTPSGVNLVQFEDYTNIDVLQSFELTADQAKGKQIILQKAQGERPVIISLPASLEGDKKPTLLVKGGLPIPVGAKEIIVQGDSLDKLKSVTMNSSKISFNVSSDKKTVNIIGLGITDDFADKELVFEFDGNVKSTLKLEFANSKNKVSLGISN